jgi:predicted nucleotidyltransferase
MLYGSLARGDFHEHSDIDLMVWGLDEQKYYLAVSELLALDATPEVDLVMAEHASPALLAAAEQEGVPL